MSEASKVGDVAKDPVCGMTVDAANAKGGTQVHDGTAYVFCSKGCSAKFQADPAKYVEARVDAREVLPRASVVAPSGTKFTCPMHPEIVRDVSGDCPICGMALEPMTVSVEEAPNEELASMTRRFWVCAALSVPLFVLAMSEMLPGSPLITALGSSAVWVQLALATPVVL